MFKFATRESEELGFFKSQQKYYSSYYEELELMAEAELKFAEATMETLMEEVEEVEEF